jgi:hypothetical protein
MISIHTKFRTPSCNILPVIAIKFEAKYKFRAVAMMLFYIVPKESLNMSNFRTLLKFLECCFHLSN